jgi:hypothetical protein
VVFVFLLPSAAGTLLLLEAHACFVKNSGAHSQLVMVVLCRSQSGDRVGLYSFEWSLSHCLTAERHNVPVVSKKPSFPHEISLLTTAPRPFVLLRQEQTPMRQ